jgi:Uma2 family endonuclease
MSARPQDILVSEAQYLRDEQTREHRAEFVDGLVLAMAGTTKRHNRIAGNAFVALRAASSCEVYMADVRTVVRSNHFYPDLVLSCTEDADPLAVRNPCVIVEVLSESTANFDRSIKLREFRKLASLEAYVLIEQDARFVEVYRRTGETWSYTSVEAGSLTLPCVDQPISLDAIYAGVELAPVPVIVDSPATR